MCEFPIFWLAWLSGLVVFQFLLARLVRLAAVWYCFFCNFLAGPAVRPVFFFPVFLLAWLVGPTSLYFLAGPAVLSYVGS